MRIRVAFNRTNHSHNLKDGGERPVWVALTEHGSQFLASSIVFLGSAWTDSGPPEQKLFSATKWLTTDDPINVIDENGLILRIGVQA